MKIFKLILAALAAIWTVGVLVGVVKGLDGHGGTRGVTELAAGIAAFAMCLTITVWIFQWALRKPSGPASASTGSDST
jgi:hypothetical protein